MASFPSTSKQMLPEVLAYHEPSSWDGNHLCPVQNMVFFFWVSVIMRLDSEGPKLNVLYKTNPKTKFKEV